MKYITKADLGYAVVTTIFTVLAGLFMYDGTASSFYGLASDNLLGNDLSTLMLLAFWAMPKIVVIIYLVQVFVTNYETCYVYFKIRSKNNNLWFYHIIKRLSAKLFVFTILKCLIIFMIVGELDYIQILYEYLYILLFACIYNCIYLLMKYDKITIYTVMGHLLVYAVVAMVGSESIKSYVFLNNLDVVSILFILGVTIVFNELFKVLLKFKNNVNGGSV